MMRIPGLEIFPYLEDDCNIQISLCSSMGAGIFIRLHHSNCDNMESLPNLAYCEGDTFSDGSGSYDKYFATCYMYVGRELPWQEAKRFVDHGYDGLALFAAPPRKIF